MHVEGKQGNSQLTRWQEPELEEIQKKKQFATFGSILSGKKVQRLFREEQCLCDICVTFKSFFRLILHFFFSLIDCID